MDLIAREKNLSIDAPPLIQPKVFADCWFDFSLALSYSHYWQSELFAIRGHYWYLGKFLDPLVTRTKNQ